MSGAFSVSTWMKNVMKLFFAIFGGKVRRWIHNCPIDLYISYLLSYFTLELGPCVLGHVHIRLDNCNLTLKLSISNYGLIYYIYLKKIKDKMDSGSCMPLICLGDFIVSCMYM